MPEYVAHDNWDSTDSRIENLKAATCKQNNQDRPKQKNNTSGYIGVTKSLKKFMARIRINGNIENLGTYVTAEEAAKVYDAAVEHHSEPGFRVYNFPEGRPR